MGLRVNLTIEKLQRNTIWLYLAIGFQNPEPETYNM